MKLSTAGGTIVPKFIALSFALLLLASISATRVYGQARPSPLENVISIDPLTIPQHYPLMFQYEMKAGPVDSWLFRLHYWFDASSDVGWAGYGVGAAYRFYIADSRALTGLSVAPAADIFFIDNSMHNYSAVTFDIGVDLAYKWIFDDFAIEPLVGFRVGFSGSNPAPTYATGAEFMIGLSLGYAF